MSTARGDENYEDQNWHDDQDWGEDYDEEYEEEWQDEEDYPEEPNPAEREDDPRQPEQENPQIQTSSHSPRRSRRAREDLIGVVSHDQDPRANGSGPYGSRRIVHDIPPTWDGKDPKIHLEPYLKLLKGWLATTQTIKSQRGYLIMQYSAGTLRELIDDLDTDQLLAEDSGQKVLEYITAQYQEFVNQYKMPTRIEECFYESDRYRKKGESMVTYIARRRTRFEKLKKEGWQIPEKEKGYFLYRDANLPDKARELIEIWSNGVYDWESMSGYLRKLERPVPGHVTHGGSVTRMIGFMTEQGVIVEHEDDPNEFRTENFVSLDPAVPDSQAAGPDYIFMENSFFLTPESFDDDEILMAAIDTLTEDDVIWLPED